jgi:hypothetical protein
MGCSLPCFIGSLPDQLPAWMPLDSSLIRQFLRKAVVGCIQILQAFLGRSTTWPQGQNAQLYNLKA